MECGREGNGKREHTQVTACNIIGIVSVKYYSTSNGDDNWLLLYFGLFFFFYAGH